MERTDQVRHQAAPAPTCTFSIKGIPAIQCDGDRNIPDGEVFTAPVRDSRQRHDPLQRAVALPGRHLRQRPASTSRRAGSSKRQRRATDELNEILDTDEGARYVGEFALGFNPYITRPDEGHPLRREDRRLASTSRPARPTTTPTTATARRSTGTWCCIQTPEYGGGEIWFDGELIRKDGRFVLAELEGLNPERLI